MKVCILGNGLSSLSLAKALTNLGIYVDIFPNQKIKNQNKTRTLAISKSNIDFFNLSILNIEKFLWDIKKIEIYSENLNNEKILDFENNNKRLFSIVKNYELYNYLFSNLKKNKFFRIKDKFFYKNLIRSDYKLIINSDSNNQITKKFFYNRFKKNYKSFAHTTIIKHKKLLNNSIAFQTFTKKGPIAFLPVSNDETSVVYSALGSKDIELEKIIQKYNYKYEIKNISKTSSFELNSSNLRTYYYNNILAFGDLLHKLHPLAGQGFNMSLRDIKELTKLINERIKNGLDINYSICHDFEKNVKHKNYIFSNGIDFIYEVFNIENKLNNNIFSRSIRFVGKNKFTNNIFTKFADNGMII
tara:strand:+ start:34 stop:1107 length:1074 start_codon:yes stop_codon:yes gene_type:complete